MCGGVRRGEERGDVEPGHRPAGHPLRRQGPGGRALVQGTGQKAPAQGCLKYFWKVKVPDRYYARNETSGTTFAKIGALLLDFAILLLFWHFG